MSCKQVSKLCKPLATVRDISRGTARINIQENWMMGGAKESPLPQHLASSLSRLAMITMEKMMPRHSCAVVIKAAAQLVGFEENLVPLGGAIEIQEEIQLSCCRSWFRKGCH